MNNGCNLCGGSPGSAIHITQCLNQAKKLRPNPGKFFGKSMIEELDDAVKKLKNSPYPVGGPDIKILFSPTINNNKEKAKRWFNKNWKKLVIEKPKGSMNFNFDTILIKENEDYKIWNPRKPFKGKNPKYNCAGFEANKIYADFGSLRF